MKEQDGVLRWGRDGAMGQDSRLWAEQQDVERTQKVDWSPKVNRRLAKPEGGQEQGVVLTGRSLGPSLGMQLPFLPAGPPWGELAWDPPAHPGPGVPEPAEHCEKLHPKLSSRPGHVP